MRLSIAIGVNGGVCSLMGCGVEGKDLLLVLERGVLVRGDLLLFPSGSSSVYEALVPAAANLAEVLVGVIWVTVVLRLLADWRAAESTVAGFVFDGSEEPRLSCSRSSCFCSKFALR